MTLPAYITESGSEVAQVLEDAADLLVVYGRRHDGHSGYPEWAKGESVPLCAYGAMCAAAATLDRNDLDSLALDALERSVFGDAEDIRRVFDWNDATKDDFVIIDAMRRVAKDLRNNA